MANYISDRTGQAHDNDEDRLTSLENNISCLSSSGTTGQFLRGDKTWNNVLTNPIYINTHIGIFKKDGDNGEQIINFYGDTNRTLFKNQLCASGSDFIIWSNSKYNDGSLTWRKDISINRSSGAITLQGETTIPNLYLTSTIPINFYGSGNGTYNRGTLYVSQSDGILFETPRASDSSNATIKGFYIRTRGGQYAPAYAASWNTGSKREYKENIKKYDGNAIELINTIKISQFNFKGLPEDNKIGFIADDTHEIFAGKNHDIMDINNCVGMLLKAVQELSAENKELKQRISKLEQVINNG